MSQKTFKAGEAQKKNAGQQRAFTSRGGWERSSSGAFRAKMTYTNDQIKAPNIMIIDDERVNLGTFPRRVAFEMAAERWLDLVQLTYDAEKMLSTVRMTDYGKYMYQKSKEEKERKRTQKGKATKEVKISYAIWDNDLQLKMKKAQEVLEGGDNVKISMRLRWRERMYADKAIEKLRAIQDILLEYGRSQYDIPKKEANGYSVILFSK